MPGPMEGSSTETRGFWTASPACDTTCQSSTDAAGSSSTHGSAGGITCHAGRGRWSSWGTCWGDSRYSIRGQSWGGPRVLCWSEGCNPALSRCWEQTQTTDPGLSSWSLGWQQQWACGIAGPQPGADLSLTPDPSLQTSSRCRGQKLCALAL